MVAVTQHVAQYLEAVRAGLDGLEAKQLGAIEEAARLLADTVKAGSRIFAFGAAHSAVPVEEIFYRAGGFVLINPLFAPGLTLNARPVTTTTEIERLEGYAKAVLRDCPLGEGDLLIVVSTAGRNAVPIEMALEAKERGARVIALTSLEYSKSVTSRHSSGKKLYELADLVLDNGAAPGDAAITVEGLAQRMGPTSGVVGAVLLHSVLIETVARLVRQGMVPPVFTSANLDGGDEANGKLMEQYRHQILYL